MELVDSIIELRILLSACDGFTDNGKNSILSTRLKILFLLEHGDCGPKELVNSLCIAKSNIAGILKKMCQESVVEIYKSEKNSKNIYYKITVIGEKELKNYKEKLLSQMQKYLDKSTELTNNINSVINILKGKNHD